jgi:CheY-like chemotaxis protein
VVEDDRKTASLVALYLQREGFETIMAHDGQTGLELAQRHRPILVILDLMLPKLDGWEVCRRLHRDSDVPVIMLTARGDEIDRVSGLTLGADDYVVKPFSPRELVARAKAVLRRTTLQPLPSEGLLAADELTLDTHKRTATLAGRPLSDLASLGAILLAGGLSFFLMHQVLAPLARQFESKAIAVDNRIAGHDGEVPADPDMLAQILRNLFENASQYTPAGGSLHIFTEHFSGHLKVICANTCADIDRKDLVFIFERFYRAEKSRSRDHGGAGDRQGIGRGSRRGR